MLGREPVEVDIEGDRGLPLPAKTVCVFHGRRRLDRVGALPADRALGAASAGPGRPVDESALYEIEQELGKRGRGSLLPLLADVRDREQMRRCS